MPRGEGNNFRSQLAFSANLVQSQNQNCWSTYYGAAI